MPDVCQRHALHDQDTVSPTRFEPIRPSHHPQTSLQTSLDTTPKPSQKYQNLIRSPYAPVPRPPQTRAASFKRLYRK
jgi:hypothetical protein